jgi:uncharacterized alpha-E superfamily protein
VADLLILNPQMPRSLASCYENISRFLDAVGQSYGHQGASQRQARKILNDLARTNIDAVFHQGLHEFIQRFLNDNNHLGHTISEQYLQ